MKSEDIWTPAHNVPALQTELFVTHHETEPDYAQYNQIWDSSRNDFQLTGICATNSNGQCYNDSDNASTLHIEWQGQNMSLIIMARSKYGVVGVADTKSTLYDTQNIPFEEKDRVVTKLFTTSNAMIGCHGYNRIICNNTWLSLETVVQKILTQYSTANDFITELYQVSREHFSIYPTHIYNFIFAQRGYSDVYELYAQSITKDGITNKCVLTGNSLCAGMLDMLPRKFDTYIGDTLETLEHKLKAVMESAMILGDTLLAYNPIGGDIVVQRFV